MTDLSLLDDGLRSIEQWARNDPALSPPRVAAQEQVSLSSPQCPHIPALPCSQFELDVPYLDITGSPQYGAARLLVPHEAALPLPLVAVMHYELGPEAAVPYLAQHWAVLTTRQGLVAAGDSINFNAALASLARLMPFVQPSKIALVGGSAGGYVSLMVATDAFPLAGIVPFVPPLNLAYTMAYLHHAAEVSGCPASFPTDPEGWREFSRQLPVPVVCFVQSIFQDLEALLGPYGPNADNWRRASPVSLWPLVTCPVLLGYSTADVLVPMQQLDPRHVQQPNLAEWPPGYSFDFDVVLPQRAGPDSLAEVLDPDSADTSVLPVPDDLPTVWEDDPGGLPLSIELPFSSDHRVSLVVLDEGPPEPRATHTKRRFAASHLQFLRHCLSKPLTPASLTQPKLERLMMRLLGQEPDGLLDCRGTEPQPLRRRSSPQLEKADVLLGLKAYLDAGDPHRNTLAALYAQLPPALRALDQPGAPFESDPQANLSRMLENLRVPLG